MKLSPEQGQKVIDYVKGKIGTRNVVCPICGNTQWEVINIVTEMREFQNGNLAVGGDTSVLPFIPMACKNCGHTYFINAITAGIVIPQSPKTDSQ